MKQNILLNSFLMSSIEEEKENNSVGEPTDSKELFDHDKMKMRILKFQLF